MAESRSRGPYTPKSGRYAGEVFTSRQEYRNRLAQDQGYKNAYEARHNIIPDNPETRFWIKHFGEQIAGAPERVEQYAIEHSRDFRDTPAPVDAIRGNSRFAQLYREAARSRWDKSYDGPFAKFLEYLHLREPGWTNDVGDSPK